MSDPCNYGRACMCSECRRCGWSHCGLTKTIVEQRYGPRGGLTYIKYKCICQDKRIKNIVGKKHADDIFTCSICETSLDKEEKDLFGLKCYKKNGVYGDIIDVKVGNEIIYTCKNEANHDSVIEKYTCSECNSFVQDLGFRLMINGKCVCKKCNIIAKTQIKCQYCDDYVWKDNELKNKMHDSCKVNKIKEETKPDYDKLARFYFSEYQEKWVSHWDNDKWKKCKVPYGKFKGETLEKMSKNKSYCKWFKNKINFDEEDDTEFISALCYMLYYT